jgi:hypothetical protein
MPGGHNNRIHSVVRQHFAKILNSLRYVPPFVIDEGHRTGELGAIHVT